jgi:glycosyltransferase involved in cell wall biosynthesis
MEFPRDLMILDLCPYWVTPVTGGGPLRVFNLNKNVACSLPVRQFSLRPTYIMRGVGENILKSREIIHSKNYVETCISNPLVYPAIYMLYKLSLPSDVVFPYYLNLVKNKSLEKGLIKADIVQFEHPWLYNFIKDRRKDQVLVASSHNCEARFLLTQNRRIREYLMDIERQSIESADVVFAVSESDVKEFHEFLNVKRRDSIFIVPNGVDCKKYRPASPSERDAAKRQLGLSGKQVVLFTGSIHKPNNEALEIILDAIAPTTDDHDTVFLIVGGVGEGRKSRDNVRFTGYAKDVDVFLKASDLAINPLISGSGTSLKMLEFMAAGLPVISTSVGARGFNIRHREQAIITSTTGFSHWIQEILNDRDLYASLSVNGRTFVENNFDWQAISKKALKIYNQFL